MHTESLDSRRLFSMNSFLGPSSSWYTAGDFDYSGHVVISDFALLAANFSQVFPSDLPRDADLNGDSRVDLADFNHFCETAVESIANNFIRKSAGPGDSDGNGRIDKFDIRALGASFNSSGNWQNGDFTMNRRVNIQDFALAAANVLAK